MSTLADRIVAVASAEIGVAESPPGSNTGPRVSVYQAATSLGGTGWPWCGAFARWSYRQAGCPDDLNPANPSTWLIYTNARDKGWLGHPQIGGLILWPGTHVGIVVGLGNGVVFTVEGNTGDAVRAHTRDIAGAKFVNSPALGTVFQPPRLYWIGDPGAKYEIKGPWRKQEWAKEAKESLSPAWQRRTDVIRTGKGKWVIRIGDDPTRGPFLDPTRRDAVMAQLEKSLGRELRPYSVLSDLPPVVPGLVPTGPAAPLGKTT